MLVLQLFPYVKHCTMTAMRKTNEFVDGGFWNYYILKDIKSNDRLYNTFMFERIWQSNFHLIWIFKWNINENIINYISWTLAAKIIFNFQILATKKKHTFIAVVEIFHFILCLCYAYCVTYSFFTKENHASTYEGVEFAF